VLVSFPKEVDVLLSDDIESSSRRSIKPSRSFVAFSEQKKVLILQRKTLPPDSSLQSVHPQPPRFDARMFPSERGPLILRAMFLFSPFQSENSFTQGMFLERGFPDEE